MHDCRSVDRDFLTLLTSCELTIQFTNSLIDNISFDLTTSSLSLSLRVKFRSKTNILFAGCLWNDRLAVILHSLEQPNVRVAEGVGRLDSLYKCW